MYRVSMISAEMNDNIPMKLANLPYIFVRKLTSLILTTSVLIAILVVDSSVGRGLVGVVSRSRDDAWDDNKTWLLMARFWVKQMGTHSEWIHTVAKSLVW